MSLGGPTAAPDRRLALGALVILTVLAMGLVAGNSWVQDEGPLILENARVHDWSGLWTAFRAPWWPPPMPGGLYRPLAQSLTTILWMIGGGSALVFKIGSLLCYLFAVLAVWGLAQRLLPAYAAWSVAALFAVHPVHTEAVAVAVNQGESMVTGLVALAVGRWLDWLNGRREGRTTLPLIGALYLVALGFKEHALILPGLLAVTALLPVTDPLAPVRPRRIVAGAIAGLSLIGVGFWTVRTWVLGGAIAADPAHGLPVEFVPRALTMLGVVPHWVRLLLWPSHLQADYAPLEIAPWAGWSMMQTLGVLALLAVAAFLVWSRRRRPVAALGAAWVLIALVPISNILVTTGVLVAERTLMLASVGAMIALLALIPKPVWNVPRQRTPLAVAIGALLVLGVLRSAQRMPDWHDATAYVKALSRDAPSSWHTLVAVGVLEMDAGNRREGEARLRTAMAIAPWHSRPPRTLARYYRLDGLCAPAIPLLERAVALDSIDQYSRLSLVACELDQAQYPAARLTANAGIAGPGRALQAAFRAALVTTDSAEQAHAPLGSVRLAPFADGWTVIGPVRLPGKPQ